DSWPNASLARAGLPARSSSAEAAPAPRVRRERVAQLAGPELRPQRVDEDELGVRELPEQEVRDSELAGRPDQQVGIRQLGRVEVRGERVLVDLARVDSRLREPASGLDDLGPSAVVERDPELEPVVLRRLALERGHLPPQRLRRAVAPAEEADADALLHEVGELAVDRVREDLHQRVDLV